MAPIQRAATLALTLQNSNAEASELTPLNIKDHRMTTLNNSFKHLVLAGLLCASAGFSLALSLIHI